MDCIDLFKRAAVALQTDPVTCTGPARKATTTTRTCRT